VRVLHIAPFYEPAWAFGGMARAASALGRALVGLGHEVSVLTARLDPGDPLEETLGGVRVRRLDGPAVLQERLVPWAHGLRAALARQTAACDVAHVHGHRTPMAAVAAHALSRAGVPYVLQPHGTYPHHGRRRLAKAVWDRVVGRAIVAGAADLLAVSECERRDLPRGSTLVGNGVAPPALATERPQRAPRRLLFVGNGSPQKRAATLPALLDALPEATLDLAGSLDAASLRPFERFGARVRALGVLGDSELAAAYAQAALLVHPAVDEAFGLVAFEAALAGTASVVAGGHGCGEWYGRAGGCVVTPDGTGALAAAVRARFADPGLAAAEAARVAEFARRELRWEAVARRVLDVYAVTVGERRG
jgi:glycosyltransferase involved in cell wall biosynthesis